LQIKKHFLRRRFSPSATAALKAFLSARNEKAAIIARLPLMRELLSAAKLRERYCLSALHPSAVPAIPTEKQASEEACLR